jgi:hypothetical protein
MTRQPEQPQDPPARVQLSAQTLFRILALDPQAEAALHSIYASRKPDETMPAALQALVNIGKAQNPAQLVAVTSQSLGVAQQAWSRRMSKFGAEAIPAITRRLKSSQSISDDRERHLVVERMLVALFKLGEPGAQAILECFNSLDTYSQSLACVTLGVLHHQPATDTVWRYYQRIKDEADLGAITGVLWGLIDLQHPQTDQALATLLDTDVQFTEQYNQIAHAGGPACVRSLAHRLNVALADAHPEESERYEILFVLAAIGHRLGEEQFQAILRDAVEPEESVAAIVSMLHQYTPEAVAKHFNF